MLYGTKLLLCFFLVFGCGTSKPAKPVTNYTSETLVITRITPHVYQHTSFLATQSFGKVPCNGMVVIDGNEAIVFDTPSDTATSLELIDWIENELNHTITAIVPTHFHEDCLGGLKAFHEKGIPSYANALTIALAEKQGYVPPQNGFDELLELKVGSKKAIVEFPGEGHTKDNVIGYLPDEKVMFGGCLVKELGAGKGYLADANVTDWPTTVQLLKSKYPETQIVIPGHGKSGGLALLDYTLQLFKAE